LQRVLVDNTEQPIRQEGRRVMLPVVPGLQTVELQWREPRGIGLWFASPAVEVGLEGVNATEVIQVPADRWTLLVGGPRMGPAVLFWGVLLVMALVAVALGRFDITPLRAYQWFLLGLGLMPVATDLAALVFGWLLLLGVRRRLGQHIAQRWAFNLLQIALVLLTFSALGGLFDAVQQGLLGRPDMQVQGYDSSADLLTWYRDHSAPVLPHVWVASLPLLAYRLLMLVWASWLAWSLLTWLKWGWEAFSAGGVLWRKGPPRKSPVAKQHTGGAEAPDGIAAKDEAANPADIGKQDAEGAGDTAHE
jgi:hypothetical protein